MAIHTPSAIPELLSLSVQDLTADPDEYLSRIGALKNHLDALHRHIRTLEGDLARKQETIAVKYLYDQELASTHNVYTRALHYIQREAVRIQGLLVLQERAQLNKVTVDDLAVEFGQFVARLARDLDVILYPNGRDHDNS